MIDLFGTPGMIARQGTYLPIYYLFPFYSEMVSKVDLDNFIRMTENLHMSGSIWLYVFHFLKYIILIIFNIVPQIYC